MRCVRLEQYYIVSLDNDENLSIIYDSSNGDLEVSYFSYDDFIESLIDVIPKFMREEFDVHTHLPEPIPLPKEILAICKLYGYTE